MALPTQNYISCFSGIGGLDLSVRLALPNAKCVCYVESEVPAAANLASRLAESSLDDAPIWFDIRTFHGSAWRGLVDGIVAGFPCPDYSVAGRRAGIVGKHGQLWNDLCRVICEVQPEWLYLENVPGIVVPHKIRRWRWNRDERRWTAYRLPAGLWFVLGDLAVLRFDAEWGCLPAAQTGAPHKRNRWFCLAYRTRRGLGELRQSSELNRLIGGGAARNFWSSPVAMDGGKQSANSQQGANLTRDAEQWKTPHGMGNVDANGKHGGVGGGEFAKQVTKWKADE